MKRIHHLKQVLVRLGWPVNQSQLSPFTCVSSNLVPLSLLRVTVRELERALNVELNGLPIRGHRSEWYAEAFLRLMDEQLGPETADSNDILALTINQFISRYKPRRCYPDQNGRLLKDEIGYVSGGATADKLCGKCWSWTAVVNNLKESILRPGLDCSEATIITENAREDAMWDYQIYDDLGRLDCLVNWETEEDSDVSEEVLVVFPQQCGVQSTKEMSHEVVKSYLQKTYDRKVKSLSTYLVIKEVDHRL